MEPFISIKKNSKAQIWSLDLIIACVIFLMGIIIIYIYAINYTSQANDILGSMFYEGNLASEIILSPEFPGILSDNKINQAKLDEFAAEDYSAKKGQLNLIYDFYFTVNNLEINSTPANYAGKINSTEITDRIKITRLTIYKNKPTKFELYVWREK